MDEQQTPDPAPRTGRKKPPLGALAGLALIFGPLLLAVGYQKSGVRDATAGEPAGITLAELTGNGPGENLYVDLSGFRFGEHYVIEEGAGNVWTGAWVYLFAKGDRRNPVAVAHLFGGGEKGIRASMRRKSIRGLMSAKRKPFGATVGRRLRKSYPHLKADAEMYHIKQIAERPGGGTVQALFIAGVVLSALGVVLMIAAVRKRTTPGRFQGQ